MKMEEYMVDGRIVANLLLAYFERKSAQTDALQARARSARFARSSAQLRTLAWLSDLSELSRSALRRSFLAAGSDEIHRRTSARWLWASGAQCLASYLGMTVEQKQSLGIGKPVRACGGPSPACCLLPVATAR